MSESSDSLVPYQVISSEHVRTELKKLLTKAKALGLGRQAFDAAKQIDYLLRVYPQFGEPLQDLPTQSQTIFIGTVPPLVVRYVLDEARRLVFLTIPFKAIPNSGF